MTAPGSNAERPRNLRLFVAIPLPEAIKEEIGKAQGRLRSALPESDIGWTKREQFHLTLKFLGNVAVERVESLKKKIQEAGRGFSPLRLRAKGIGFFPERGEPRVIWAGIGDDYGSLASLQEAIEKATLDFAEKENQFTAHVTLGRVRRIRRNEVEALQRASASVAEKSFGEWTAGKIAVMRSDLTPDGARHEILFEINLGK